MIWKITTALLLAAGACCGAAASSATPPASAAMLAARVQVLEDREQIRELLKDYGRTLDRRDFEGFAKLFAAAGEYESGGALTRGPAAIAQSLQDIMARNPLGFKSPNFHVFFNEYIEVTGDHATSSSQSVYIVPSDGNRPELALMAAYEDQLVREDGRWKFLKRIVHGQIPAPRPRP